MHRYQSQARLGSADTWTVCPVLPVMTYIVKYIQYQAFYLVTALLPYTVFVQVMTSFYEQKKDKICSF